MIDSLNSGVIFLICGGIILFVAIVCVIFLVRAYRAGKRLGMDVRILNKTIVSSATFSVLPSIGILLGVIALSGSLGTPWPWLRLSVIGALHYETQVAEAAAEQVGMTSLDPAQMTASGFATIALLMSICIMWGMVMSIFFNKMYSGKMGKSKKKKSIGEIATKQENENGEIAAETTKADTKAAETDANEAKTGNKKTGFGDIAMSAMFIGLVSAYIGSYIGEIVSGNGMFSFTGSWTALFVAAVSGLVMAGFTYLIEKKNVKWLESFSIAGSMLIGMVAAIFVG